MFPLCFAKNNDVITDVERARNVVNLIMDDLLKDPTCMLTLCQKSAFYTVLGPCVWRML